MDLPPGVRASVVRVSSKSAHPLHGTDSTERGVPTGSSGGGSLAVPFSDRELTPTELLGPLNEVERKFAPARLFASGRAEIPLPHPRIAIVGTREASVEGLEAARDLAKTFVENGAIVVSGLALGIDAAAHTAAIEAGGRTMAVLGTPLSRSYPPQNEPLQALIAKQHLAISQFSRGSPIRKENFVLRNRTMALVADASIIVESGEQGGALHQGWEAIRLGRPLFIRRNVMADSRLAWPKAMQRYGAVAFRDPRDILDFVPESLPGILADDSG